MYRGILPALCGIVILLLCAAAPASASIDLGSPNVRLSGFGTLGFTRGGNDILGFHRDLERKGVFGGHWTSRIDSVLGLQLDADFTDSFSAAVQVMAKNSKLTHLDDYLTWAFLRYRLNPSWTVRVGRMGIDLFMLSENREVGFSYLWVRPPVELYSIQSFRHFDGVDAAYTRPLGIGTFTAKMFAGKTGNQFRESQTSIDINIKPFFGTTLGWETEDWQTRFSFASLKVDSKGGYLPGSEPLTNILTAVTPIWPGAADYLGTFQLKDAQYYYYALGVGYNNHPWVAQSELDYLSSNTRMLSSLAGGYVSLGYQIGPTTLYGMFAKVNNTKGRVQVAAPPVSQLQPLQQVLQSIYDGLMFNQKTVSVGMRWDVRYDLALKLQWDHTWVNKFGTGYWDVRSLPTKNESLNTVSINLSGVF